MQRLPRPLLALLFLALSFGATLRAQDNLTEMIPRMEYPNADVIAVLRVYEDLTKKRIVPDNTVQGQVNIVVNSPVTKEEAIKIIEINLAMNGFSLIPAGGDIIKVVGNSKNPRTAGVPIYTNAAELPEGDRIVTFLFKLQHANPSDLANTLLAYLSPQIWTAVVPVPSSQSLLVTENTSVIRSIMRIVSEVDVPPAEVVSEFISLRRADATEVIEKLKAIFETQPTSGTGTATITRPAGQQRPPQVEGQPPGVPVPEAAPSVEITPGKLSEDSIIIGKIRLTADIRTNRIHVVTRPVNLVFIRTLIDEFDSDVSFGEPTARALKYVSAGDILDVVVQSISEPGVEAREGAAGAAGAAGRTGTTARQTGGGGGTVTGGASNGTSGGLTVSEGLSTEPVDTTPEAVIVGNTKIIADKRRNAIIVLGNQEVKQKIFALLDEMDVRAPQVLLNTVIGELTLTDNEEFGIDYLFHSAQGPLTAVTGTGGGVIAANAPRAGFAGIGRNTGVPILDASNIINAAAFGNPAAGLTAYLAPTDSLQLIVHALEMTDRFHVTSRPMVFTSNNKKAIIASGQEIAVPVQSLASGGTGVNGVASVQSSIQFKTVALQLEVVPLINSDREVSLDILQKVDSVAGTSTIDGNAVPIISTRYIKTNVSVVNRGTVILGGLITKNTDKGYSGLPVLSRIPLIGPLFRNTRDNKTRTELIILMRPIVTLEPEETTAAREREEERLVIPPDLDTTLDVPGKRPVLPKQKNVLRPPPAPLRQ